MKKFLVLTVCLLCLSHSVCWGEGKGAKIGILSKVSGETEKSFTSTAYLSLKWLVFSPQHGDHDEFRYYDDLPTMLLALEAGEIEEIDLPDLVAEYVIAANPEYEVSCAMSFKHDVDFVFGFLKDKSEELRGGFDSALSEMKKDGTLMNLRQKYAANPLKNEPDPVVFTDFPDAKTVKIAVTGDIPPLDCTGSDGKASGFNAAILAEIGRRLKINIELMNIHSASRTIALTSGRADGVFWYMLDGHDFPQEKVIISQPYYTFNTFLHIRKKNK